MATTIKLFCILLSADGKLSSEPFGMDLQPGTTVGDLRKNIVARKFPKSPVQVELDLWRPEYPLRPRYQTFADKLKDILRHDPMNVGEGPRAEPLDLFVRITEKFYEDLGEDSLHIIAQVPEGTVCSVGDLRKRRLTHRVRDLSIEFCQVENFGGS
jgi:hypothetical protein